MSAIQCVCSERKEEAENVDQEKAWRPTFLQSRRDDEKKAGHVLIPGSKRQGRQYARSVNSHVLFNMVKQCGLQRTRDI